MKDALILINKEFTRRNRDRSDNALKFALLKTDIDSLKHTMESLKINKNVEEDDSLIKIEPRFKSSNENRSDRKSVV